VTNVDAVGPGRLDSPQGADSGADGVAAPYLPAAEMDVPSGKPTVDALGIDVSSLVWQRSGEVRATGSGSGDPPVADPDLGGPPGPAMHEGAIEVALVGRPQGETWVLVRVAGDPAGRVLVYDQHEWECFLDGVRKGEFDGAR
jgi:hypothetical protein